MSNVHRVYASLLGTNFELSDDNVVVCTAECNGQVVSEITSDTDPFSLVGSGSSSPAQDVVVPVGAKFKFRMPNPIVTKSSSGAKLAYLISL